MIECAKNEVKPSADTRHTMIEYHIIPSLDKAVGIHMILLYIRIKLIDILLLDGTVLYETIWYKCQQHA
jgi:hypothetical protein